jgi:hypothetical protein
MVEDNAEKPSDASISSYLRLSLRRLEKAQQDRGRAPHQLAQASSAEAAPLDPLKPEPILEA